MFPLPQKHYYYEMVLAALLVLYTLNYLVGSRKNKSIARQWAHAFAAPGGIFDKNFACIGPANDKVCCGGRPIGCSDR